MNLNPKDWREWRRMRAVQLKEEGWCQRDIADALDVSEVSVSQWLARAREGGPAALLARPSAGQPPKLSADCKRRIPEFLSHGAEAYGFQGQFWTCARIARIIGEELAVFYHKDHVSRLLRELGWTPQMPIRRASQRDEVAISRWREHVWPKLLRESRRERRTLVFVDESGFYLLPSVVRTYAPVRQTPIITARLTRDHLSVMGGMTPQGKIYALTRQAPLNGMNTIEFLVHLLHVAGPRLLVIWDGSPIHRRKAVNDFVEETDGRIRVEALPGYAPDLNPWDEGGWHYLKHVEMRNLPCRDLEELHQEFHLALDRLRRHTNLIESFFAQAGLTLGKT